MHSVSEIGKEMARNWWAGVLVLVVTVAAAHVFTTRQAPVYRSSATVVAQPNPALTETADLLRSLEALERRTILATFSELATSARIRARAAEGLGITSADFAAYRVTSSIVPNTNILRISAEGPDAGGVARLAQAIAIVIGDEAQQLYQPFALRTLSEAVTPRAPRLPDPRRNTVVAIVIGLFLGAGLAFALGRLGRMRRVTAPRALEAHATR